MLKHIKNLFKANLIIIAISFTIGIACLSLIKMPNTKINIVNIDKFYHSFAYFMLAITWLFTFYKKPEKKYLIIILCIVFGIIIEITQSKLTNYRTGDYLDAISNTCGVLLALLIYNLISKKNYIN